MPLATLTLDHYSGHHKQERNTNTNTKEETMNVSTLSDLTTDGDTLQLPNGSLRVRFEADADADINDFVDCYGQFSYNHFGDEPRPDGFDGSSRKIHTGRDSYWWQPPSDIKSDPQAIEDLRHHVVDLLGYGFTGVVVELWETVPDSFGGDHEVLVTANYIGGVDSTDPSYLAELVSDLASDLVSEFNLEVPS